MSRWIGLSWIGLVAGMAGCCVPPPTTLQGLEYGFQTPQQAYESFRTAFQGELLEYEYRCFSRGFKERCKGLTGYLEIRDQLIADTPFLRLGVYDARIVAVDRPRPDRAVIHAQSHGHGFRLSLVREEFWEIYVEGELLDDGAVGDLLAEGIAQVEETPRGSGRYILWGRVDLDDPALAGRFSSLTFGREWKIDQFEIAEGQPAP